MRPMPAHAPNVSPAAPALTADVNALAWGQFHLRGGWTRLWAFAGFYTVVAGSLVALAVFSGNATAGMLRMALTAMQAAILVLFVCARVSAAIRQDLTSRMIESHRLMPLSAAQGVLGYLIGPAANPLGVAAANVVVGLFLSSIGGAPAALWLTANAVLLEFAVFVALAMCFGAFAGKGSAAVAWVGFFIGIYSHAVVGFLFPALNVLVTPLAGHTVFNLALIGGDAVAFYAPVAVFHAWFGTICFIGACRRYEREDRLALGTDLGLALLAAWVATSAFGITRWDDYRPSIMFRETTVVEAQVVGSMAAAMLLGLIPVNGAAFAAADWAARRKLGDPSLGRRPVPPLLVALAAAVVVLLLAAVPLSGARFWTENPSTGWTVPADAVARTAVIMGAFFVAALYLMRIRYRRGRAGRFFQLPAWLFLSWIVPIGIDVLRWYRADDRGDVLWGSSAFSPLGSLIQVWTGRAGRTSTGLLFQVAAAGCVAAAYYLTNRATRARTAGQSESVGSPGTA